MIRLLDIYLRNPVFWDVMICTAVIGGMLYIPVVSYVWDYIVLNGNAEEIMPEISSVAISLCGFILAALTIIINFKEIVAQRRERIENSMRDATAKKGESKHESMVESAVMDFYSSKAYQSIAKIYIHAALVLLVIFLSLTILRVFSKCCSPDFMIVVVGVSVVLIMSTTARCIYLVGSLIMVHDKFSEETTKKEDRLGIDEDLLKHRKKS